MTRPSAVRITTSFVVVAILAVAVFAAFYILGAITAVAVCVALGIAVIVAVGVASAKIARHRDSKAMGTADAVAIPDQHS